MNIIFYVCFGSFSILCIIVMAHKVNEKLLFETDPNNPYRRFCKRCGQTQEQYGKSFFGPGWWGIADRKYDPDCICHRYVLGAI